MKYSFECIPLWVFHNLFLMYEINLSFSFIFLEFSQFSSHTFLYLCISVLFGLLTQGGSYLPKFSFEYINSTWRCHPALGCFTVVLWQGFSSATMCWISEFLNIPLHESLHFFSDRFLWYKVFYRNPSSLAPSPVGIAKSRHFRGLFVFDDGGRLLFARGTLSLLSYRLLKFSFMLLSSPFNSRRALLSFRLFPPETVSQTLLLHVVSAFKFLVCTLICLDTFTLFWNLGWTLSFYW